jgi:hypothetical protein
MRLIVLSMSICIFRVRWLRPAFQNSLSKQELPAQVQQLIGADFALNPVTAAATPQPWPGALPEQVKAVAQVLASSPQALTLAQITACFAASASCEKVAAHALANPGSAGAGAANAAGRHHRLAGVTRIFQCPHYESRHAAQF